MKKTIFAIVVVLLPFISIAQGSIHGIATFTNPLLNIHDEPERGASVYICPTDKVEFDNDIYLKYINFHNTVSRGNYGVFVKYIGGGKLNKSEKRAIVDSAKTNYNIIGSYEASISVNASDKTLVDENGKFLFSNVPIGKYYVMIVHKYSGIVFRASEPEIITVEVKNNNDNPLADFSL